MIRSRSGEYHLCGYFRDILSVAIGAGKSFRICAVCEKPDGTDFSRLLEHLKVFVGTDVKGESISTELVSGMRSR